MITKISVEELKLTINGIAIAKAVTEKKPLPEIFIHIDFADKSRSVITLNTEKLIKELYAMYPIEIDRIIERINNAKEI